MTGKSKRTSKIRIGRPRVKCEWCKHERCEFKSSFVEKDKVYNYDLCAGCHVLFKTVNNTYHSDRII